MEIKSTLADFEVDQEENTFTGYASVFGNTDSHGDVIAHGAFTKTLSEAGHRVRVLFQHDMWQPIGKPLKMEEDTHGLRTVSRIAPTQLGKDTLVLLKEGVISEMSIGFDTIKADEANPSDRRSVRTLREVRLWEYSPVVWGSNELAKVTGAKSIDEMHQLLQRSGPVAATSPNTKALIENTIEALRTLLKEQPVNTTDSDPGAVDQIKSNLMEPLNELNSYIKEQALRADLQRLIH